MELPSPAQLKIEYPLSNLAKNQIAESRETAKKILARSDERLAAIIGPCSIHDPSSALEYAKKLKKLSFDVEQSLFLVMRVFPEKSRTRLGWKGMLYDPFLDGSHDLAAGLRLSRKLFLEISELGIPCCAELLEPLAVPYFDDLLVWGVIGARTANSQPHRQLASGVPFPVGFKNDIYGQLDSAVSGIFSARASHSHLGMNQTGRIAAVSTNGNPWTHLILRGSESGTNFDRESISQALQLLQSHYLPSRLIIDCSHGNSKKEAKLQKGVLESVIEQFLNGNRSIAGFMCESHLHQGKQSLLEELSSLHYGISITDSCLGWEETEVLLLSAADRIAIHSVQK